MMKMSRVFVPLALAFTLFALFGFTTSGKAFASTTATCDFQDSATSGTVYSIQGNNALATATIQVNSCTNQIRSKVVCILPSDSIIGIMNTFSPTQSYTGSGFSSTVTCSANQTIYQDDVVTNALTNYTCANIQVGDNYLHNDPLTAVGELYICVH